MEERDGQTASGHGPTAAGRGQLLHALERIDAGGPRSLGVPSAPSETAGAPFDEGERPVYTVKREAVEGIAVQGVTP